MTKHIDPFAVALRYYSEQFKYSQKDLADKIGCAQPTINKKLNNELIERDSLNQKIAEIFGQSLGEFILNGENIIETGRPKCDKKGEDIIEAICEKLRQLDKKWLFTIFYMIESFADREGLRSEIQDSLTTNGSHMSEVEKELNIEAHLTMRKRFGGELSTDEYRKQFNLVFKQLREKFFTNTEKEKNKKII